MSCRNKSASGVAPCFHGGLCTRPGFLKTLVERAGFCVGVLIFSIGLMSGCTAVPVWEKSVFADYKMKPDRDLLSDAMADHFHISREASTGGRAVGGSGCGCN